MIGIRKLSEQMFLASMLHMLHMLHSCRHRVAVSPARSIKPGRLLTTDYWPCLGRRFRLLPACILIYVSTFALARRISKPKPSQTTPNYNLLSCPLCRSSAAILASRLTGTA